MEIWSNPYLGIGLDGLDAAIPMPSIDVSAVRQPLRMCPAHGVTPLVRFGPLEDRTGLAAIFVKDERGRMGLGSFKALGAAYVLAHDAAATGRDMASAPLAGETYVTASAGNHGLSVAAGAGVFGAKAVIYLSETVSETFADRLRAKGADVVRAGAIYEDSMAAAREAAEANGWHLLSDSSWDGYYETPHRLMEGYLQMASEAFEQMEQPPTHIFLQAGVGGLAGAVAAYARAQFGSEPSIIVVEPEVAPALIASVKAGKPVFADGPVSCMGRLDCKEPSLIALKGLARDASHFMTISETEAEQVLPVLAKAGLETTPSGGAGLAGLLAASGLAAAVGLSPTSRVLTFLSEGV